MHRVVVLGCALLLSCSSKPQELLPEAPQPEPGLEKSWWRGNLHAHSLWSDGDGFAELILKDYRDAGYQFAVLSEHDNLGDYEASRSLQDIAARSCGMAYPDLMARDEEFRVGKARGVESLRLRKLPDIARTLNAAGRFLVLPAEELSPLASGLRVHVNAIGPARRIEPRSMDGVLETIRYHLAKVREDDGRGLAILNHPNHDYAVTAEDLIQLEELEFLEIFSGHRGVRWQGDGNHMPVERLWDIANSFRIAERGLPPIWGVADDDAHDYYCDSDAKPFRAWIQVRAAALTRESLFAAMRSGDFYASSGVELAALEFDANARVLSVEVDVQPGAHYEIRFVGTRRDFDRSSQPATPSAGAQRISGRYDPAIGEVFASFVDTAASYALRGDELYVRAVVVSDLAPPVSELVYIGQTAMAWTQPYGWQVSAAR